MIKDKIYSKAKELRVNLVRTCDAEQWERLPVQPPEFWPQNIWPWSKKVICLGIPLFAPMIDSTPSMVYQELYDTLAPNNVGKYISGITAEELAEYMIY